MEKCEKCGTEGYRRESKFCSKCGNTLSAEIKPEQNICTNQKCDWHKTEFIYPDGANFCDVCGSRTTKCEVPFELFDTRR
ncbi:MAG: hypothetical protein FWC79_00440 [Oscillospiraceae bacterium]|nr:hypothetical protein [Oscillospiraceae bacterium]